jgi:homotetrameric cytidine deaminase
MAKSIPSKVLHAAFTQALESRRRAHAPYSRFYVGASVILPRGLIVSGCNVENASYGATICAERNAIFTAVAQHGPKVKILGIVLVTEPSEVPCGMCLQVMSEFMTADTRIYLADTRGIKRQMKMKDLLPRSFSAKSLQ